MWAARKLGIAVIVMLSSHWLATKIPADDHPIPTIDGRPLVNSSDVSNSGYQTVDGRPLRQTVGGTTQPQPSLLDKIGTGTKNFFGRVGNWFSPTTPTTSTATLKKPSIAASNRAVDSADRVDINGSQVPIGYNADGSKR